MPACRTSFSSPICPSYLLPHGTSLQPKELAQHHCLGFNFRRSLDGWPFHGPASRRRWLQATQGNVLASNGTILRQLCLDGAGLVRVGQFLVQPDLDAGQCSSPGTRKTWS
ncbi:hypothetical protein ACFOD4_05640 [Pseudoroseomonas globiformis]|uniref:Uncharacterized protein n=1 Tax=Teichococcus globiformis TaxID=2307229 RepID=A0ABV7FYR7_9PROT